MGDLTETLQITQFHQHCVQLFLQKVIWSIKVKLSAQNMTLTHYYISQRQVPPVIRKFYYVFIVGYPLLISLRYSPLITRRSIHMKNVFIVGYPLLIFLRYSPLITRVSIHMKTVFIVGYPLLISLRYSPLITRVSIHMKTFSSSSTHC